MNKIYDKKGKLIEVQLDKGEQHYLMKENLKLLRAKSSDELRAKTETQWKNLNTVVPLKKR